MKSSRIIARFGLIIALIICAYYIDALISSGMPIRIAVTTIIVTLTVCQLFDFKTAVFTTTIFGLSSFIFTFIHPNISSPVFMNPLVSVFPRVMIGIVSGGVFIGMNKLFARERNSFLKNMLPRITASAAGVLTNTVLVITMMSITNNQNVLAKLLKVIVGTNFLIEIISGVIVVPLISFAVKAQINKHI